MFTRCLDTQDIELKILRYVNKARTLFCLHMLNLQVKIVKAYLSILLFILSKKKQSLTLHIHCRSKTVIFTFNGQNTNNSFVYIVVSVSRLHLNKCHSNFGCLLKIPR